MSANPDQQQTDGNPPEKDEGSEEESEEPDPKELRKQMKELQAKLDKIAPEESEEEEEEESEEEDKDKKPDKDKKEKSKVDPTIVDYANFLKEQLGKKYDKDLDKLPIRARIGAMKGILKVLGKGETNGVLKEGKIPKTSNAEQQPRKRPGPNFKELGKKY